MTAEERYSKCKTFQELKDAYWYDERSAETFEFLRACNRAYEKRYTELLIEERARQEDIY